MKSVTWTSDRARVSSVYSFMARRLGAIVLSAAAACGGGSKQGQTTTPSNSTGGGGGGGDSQSMANTPAPTDNAATGGGAGAPASPTSNAPDPTAGPAIAFPNQDPDPNQAKAQVDQHLNVAKQALAAPTPDPDTALREAREALKIDAANLDAAAYVAFAYYHLKQYDTAELVLDDLFKRPSAKENANV